jgi:hypothetical protein
VRALVCIVSLVGVVTNAAASQAPPGDEMVAEDDDDPKCARGECLPFAPPPLDEDDPKLARGLPLHRPTARVEVSYRFLQLADPYGGSLPFHGVEVTGFPYAGIFRVGLTLSASGAVRYDAWMFDVGLSAGVQYPYRITPFLDLRFQVGVLGANILGRSVVSYQYRPTIEGGLSVFLAGRFHLTAAVGWSHPVYGGVDANAVQMMIDNGQKPQFDVQPFSFDTVTLRVGLGF